MALIYVTVSSHGDASDSTNEFADIVAEVEEAIDDAATANAEAGSNADVTTELGAVTAALGTLESSVPSGGIVVIVDTSIVSDANKLRAYLDSAYNHLVSTSLF